MGTLNRLEERDTTMHDNIQTAIQAGRMQTQEIINKGFKNAVAMHNECKLVLLTPDKLEKPRFLTADVTFHEPDRFMDYLNAWADEASRVFYTDGGEFMAVIDYHRPEKTAPEQPGMARIPQHGDHIARLKLVPSPEWKEWSDWNGKEMGQVGFAEFIEDHARDIVSPDPMTMLRIATGLQAQQNSTFRSAINQTNGAINVAFDNQIEGKVQGTNQEIPAQFQVGLRPFMGTARYPVDCRLRYRVPNGQLKLLYKALHLDVIVEDALAKVVEHIAKETALPVAMGACKLETIKAGM